MFARASLLAFVLFAVSVVTTPVPVMNDGGNREMATTTPCTDMAPTPTPTPTWTPTSTAPCDEPTATPEPCDEPCDEEPEPCDEPCDEEPEPCDEPTPEPPCDEPTPEPPCDEPTPEPPCDEPTPEPPCDAPEPQPEEGGIQCCQSVQEAKSIDWASQPGDVYSIIPDLLKGSNIPIGLKCSPLLLGSGAQCNQQTVSCQHVHSSALIGINCIAFNGGQSGLGNIL